MKILYYSVHGVLEYDELLLFHQMGHEVFSLGLYFDHDPDGPPRPDIHIRPRPPFKTDPALLAKFKETGCARAYPNDRSNTVLTPAFLREFDLFVVMHDGPFIAENWEVLRHVPVVWRTIGQGLDVFEPLMRGPKATGLKIVRYSPHEERAPAYAGQDALIRFYRDEALYGPWNGNRKAALHYTTSFSARYPEEYRLFRETVRGLDYALGSGGNEDDPKAIGYHSYEEQREMLRDHRAYFYCCAFSIPYNLAYIEALMSGTPMVVYHDADMARAHRGYYEASALIEDGVSGLVVTSPDQGRDVLTRLFADDAFAASISTGGRRRAMELFSRENAVRNWTWFLATI